MFYFDECFIKVEYLYMIGIIKGIPFRFVNVPQGQFYLELHLWYLAYAVSWKQSLVNMTSNIASSQ